MKSLHSGICFVAVVLTVVASVCSEPNSKMNTLLKEARMKFRGLLDAAGKPPGNHDGKMMGAYYGGGGRFYGPLRCLRSTTAAATTTTAAPTTTTTAAATTTTAAATTAAATTAMPVGQWPHMGYYYY